MSDNSDATLTPSVFAISVVFGGGVGMAAAAMLGLDGGGGFLIGAALVFLFLSISVMRSRDLTRIDDLHLRLEMLLKESQRRQSRR